MPDSTPLFTPREAANMLGISYPTIKQWILNGKLKTVQTPGGHHRVSQTILQPYQRIRSLEQIEAASENHMEAAI
ncbi:MAG TPA: excisionase family DNA-binding protein [Edaphobacter sp.]|nr:excisionase family DNA-binding protein [Edaphobacter sp.]